jgi:hypothetical protein
MPAAGCLVQRRAPLAVAGNANRQQRHDSVCVAAPRCVVQRCAAKVVDGVHLCPLLPQRKHEAGVPPICRMHQRCAAAAVAGLNPCAALEQHQRHVDVAGHCRVVQRVAAVAARGFNCCPCL